MSSQMLTPKTSANTKAILQRLDEMEFFDLKRKLARIGADNLLGQGLTITSDKPRIKKFLTEIKNRINLDGLLLQAAEDCNFFGRVIFTIEKDTKGNFGISFVSNELIQRVDSIEITPMSARILRRRVVGFYTFFIWEYWTANKVIRNIEIKNKDGMVVGFNDLPADTKFPEEWNLPKEEVHNLGFVPIIDWPNREYRNGLQAGNQKEGIAYLADDYEVRNIPIQVNHILRQHFKEAIFGKSRVFGSIEANNTPEGFELSDYIMEVDPQPGSTKPIETMPASYNGANWIEPVERLINLYALGCGYSELIPKSAQMTEAESLYSKDATQRTLKTKRRRLTLLLTDLFQKLLVYKGLAKDIYADPEFSIEIKENVVYNQTQLVSFLKEAIDSQLMTRAEAIMKQRDLDDPDAAEIILKAIEEDQEKINDLMSINMEDGEEPSPNIDPNEDTRNNDPTTGGE